MKGTLREGSFTGDSKDMLSKAPEWASVSIGTPLLGNVGALFLGSLK
jgi:hypothetical protein